MKKVKMSKKDKTMIFAISVTLMLYVNRIYGMASVNDEEVMTFVNEEDAVDSHILHCFPACFERTLRQIIEQL
ncbi:hypothetical protein LWT90_22745, partial [Enterobacter hormaechei]|nr:hypothetical protein [Enterobacter hormaechei]